MPDDHNQRFRKFQLVQLSRPLVQLQPDSTCSVTLVRVHHRELLQLPQGTKGSLELNWKPSMVGSGATLSTISWHCPTQQRVATPATQHVGGGELCPPA
eukprot:1987591-Amphidinium_carterae.1